MDRHKHFKKLKYPYKSSEVKQILIYCQRNPPTNKTVGEVTESSRTVTDVGYL